jgi:thiaminase/transcriptional activator TenA
MLHEELWGDNGDLVAACREHRFVRGLAEGSLDAGVFARYVAQDAFYLEAFFRAYALAAARCEGRHEAAVVFHRLMGGVLDELAMHQGHAERLGIELAGVEPDPSTTAYVDFLMETAWGGDLGATVAAMTPCMRLYAELGRELAGGRGEGHPYGEWIDTYASEEMQALAAELEALLDELAEDSEVVRAVYRQALQLELAFFDTPFEEGG